MALSITVTNAGRIALINAANTGTAPVTIAQVGLSATGVIPASAATALPGEFKRVSTFSGDVVADNTIHLIVRDEGSEIYTVRSFALYLADGTLFAIYGQAGVILEKSAQALLLLAIDIQFEDIDATTLTFGNTNFLNPPATTTTQGVVELATDDESTTGTDAQRAVTPKGMKTAVSSWLNTRFGNGAPSDFVKGLLTAANQAAMRLALGIKSAALKDEGDGNGLDADKLDGQQGAWYTDILARLGYTPLNKAGDTMTGPLTFAGALGSNGISSGTGDGASYSTYNLCLNTWWGLAIKAAHDGTVNGFYDARTGRWDVKAGYRVNGVDVWHGGNDGSGSGLDADLLDGQQGSYYTNITGRLGYTPVQQGTGIGQLVNAIKIGWSGSRLKATVDNSDQGAFVFDANIADVWRASNDGSGSGLDADLLDGFDAAAFLRDLGHDFTQNGYVRLSNGLILQWGSIAGTWSANVDISASFPIAFPTALLGLVGTNSDVAAQKDAVVGFNYTPAPTATGFKFRTNVAGQNRINWVAIGI